MSLSYSRTNTIYKAYDITKTPNERNENQMKYRKTTEEEYLKNPPTKQPCMVCHSEKSVCILTDLHKEPLWLCATHAAEWLSKHPSK